MTNQQTSKRTASKRERKRAAMLEEALARPGVREVMDVYGVWQAKDRGLDAYRLATKSSSGHITNSNSSCSR